ncbi:hypothetical protein NDU88_005141 [Pleurodeles waltl]|uniref:Uncharacterized protein n=1 Tax=Pleurodeles waltl TaxID=8319 RepID=A0AAV7WXY2_PLEWA|nr:hypothetical protein NDU88_005141 [Pleurodeles waltl]
MKRTCTDTAGVVPTQPGVPTNEWRASGPRRDIRRSKGAVTGSDREEVKEGSKEVKEGGEEKEGSAEEEDGTKEEDGVRGGDGEGSEDEESLRDERLWRRGAWFLPNRREENNPKGGEEVKEGGEEKEGSAEEEDGTKEEDGVRGGDGEGSEDEESLRDERLWRRGAWFLPNRREENNPVPDGGPAPW